MFGFLQNKKKKGMVTFGNISGIVMSLVMAGLFIGAGVLALTAFKSGSSSASANTTVDNVVTGLTNVSTQFGTVGTMVGIGLILLIIVGVFVFARGGRNGGL